MTIDDVRALVAADESRTIELKKSTGELKDGMHAACAFLNTEGGWLIFGVTPKSLKIIGQEVTDVTPENIKEPHDSYPYNVKMAEVLYRSMWLENWGSGAKRIMEACQEQGVEEPTWRWDGAFVYVTFKRPPKHRPSTPQAPPKHDPSTTEAPTKHRPSTDQAPTKYRPSAEQIETVIQSMAYSYMSMKEIMAIVGVKHRPTFRENYLNPAIEDGAVERLYPDHPNHPKQRYRLTESAMEWKKALLSKRGE